MEREEIIAIQSKLLWEVEQRKLVNKEIYKIVGVSKNTYIKYKNSSVAMGPDKLIELGRYLRIDFNELFYKKTETDLSVVEEQGETYRCKSCTDKDKIIFELTRTISKLNDIIEGKNYKIIK